MLVLSARLHEKVHFPGSHTSVQVVAIQPGVVRLGIDAPEEVRVLRQGIPDRVAEWGPAPVSPGDETPSTLLQLDGLVQKRLEIARRGLEEARRHLGDGRAEDAEVVLGRLDEDLYLLRRRLHQEVEQAAPRAAGILVGARG
jgi:carbon storage regulator CsrA